VDQAAIGKQKTILAIDDDRESRESLSELLRARGYFVLEADNGEIAIEMLGNSEHIPFIILLDLSMPVMDGHGFLKWRAENPLVRDIPVVIISGTETPIETMADVEAILKKPVKVANFLKLINRYC
jgi:CheY-like chemotaxis protein